MKNRNKIPPRIWPPRPVSCGSIYVAMRPGDPWHACHVVVLARNTPFASYDCYLPRRWRKLARAKQDQTRPFQTSELW